MAEVSFVAGTELASTVNTLIAAPLPAGIQDGDRVVAIVFARSALTAPAGWTLLASDGPVGNDWSEPTIEQSIYAYQKDTASASDSEATATWTQASIDWIGVVYAVLRGESVTPELDQWGSLPIDAYNGWEIPQWVIYTPREALYLMAITTIEADDTVPQSPVPPSGATAFSGDELTHYRLAAAWQVISEDVNDSQFALTGEWDWMRPAGGVISMTLTFVQNVPEPEAMSAGPSPLGTVNVFAMVDPAAQVSAPSPLGLPAVFGTDGAALVWSSAPSPLSVPSAIALHSSAARSRAATPLGTPQVQAIQCLAISSARSPLGPRNGYIRASILAYHDFSTAIGDDVPIFYAGEISIGTAPRETHRVRISSWQATVQRDRQSYLQMVVPAIAEQVDLIDQALSDPTSEIAVVRIARLPDGVEIERQMALAPLDTPQIARGPERMTATLSGYMLRFYPAGERPEATDRLLTGVRSVTTGQGGPRVRCSIDWLLEPGVRAIYSDSESMVVDYINYYVTGSDAFMDVGAR